MSGFLEKNKRLVDYKITDFGREKIAEGGLNFKYYSFSDSSIVYKENVLSEKSFKVSDLSNFLPFESDVSVTNIINPEYTLSSVLSFDDLDNKLLFKNKSSNSTISDHLISLKLLDNKTLISESDDRAISFDYKLERDDFDFKSNINSYVTIKSGRISLRNIEYISKDRRFSQKTRNKFLPIKGSFKVATKEEKNPMASNKLGVLFKSFKTNHTIPEFSNRERFIVEMVSLLRKSDNIIKLDYVLNEEKKLDEDVFLFEIHKVINNENIVGEEDTLEKLSFVDLGEVYDEIEYNFKRIFLIGKFFLTRNIKDEINIENKRRRFEINNDYSFVNMFTLVVE